jgi:hypothetical protein
VSQGQDARRDSGRLDGADSPGGQQRGGGSCIADGQGSGCQGAGQRDAAPRQPGAKHLAAALQPAPQRPLGPAQLSGGFILSFALQIAEHQRRPVTFGEPLQLLVEDGAGLAQGQRVAVVGSHVDVLEFLVSPGRGGARPQCQVVRNLVKPAAEGGTVADGGGLAGQDEKRGLEDVLGILGLAQDAAARPQHEGAMPPHQRSEGCLVTVCGEAPEQFLVCQAIDVRRRQAPEMSEDI